jgi:hypothetical protein
MTKGYVVSSKIAFSSEKAEDLTEWTNPRIGMISNYSEFVNANTARTANYAI